MGLNVWFIQVFRNFYPVIIWLCLAWVALVHVFGQSPARSLFLPDAEMNSMAPQTEIQVSPVKSEKMRVVILN